MPKKKLSCPSNVKDCGPGFKERLQTKIAEGIERREIRRTERDMKKEERSKFKGTLGDSKPTKVAINYSDVKKGGMKGRINPYSI
jgi:hypothetical protein